MTDPGLYTVLSNLLQCLSVCIRQNQPYVFQSYPYITNLMRYIVSTKCHNPPLAPTCLTDVEAALAAFTDGKGAAVCLNMSDCNLV